MDAPLVGTEMVGSLLKSGWSSDMLKVWRRAVRKDAFSPSGGGRNNAGECASKRFDDEG